MTGPIRTLRVDKGFGFIKGETGQDYFFHQSAIYGEGIADLRAAVPTARIVDLPVSNPFMFLSNEADVLREIRAFADTLTGQ